MRALEASKGIREPHRAGTTRDEATCFASGVCKGSKFHQNCETNKPQQEQASSKLRDASKESAMAEMPSEVRSAAKERISETRSLARNELHPSREPRARNPQFKLNLHMMKLHLIVLLRMH